MKRILPAIPLVVLISLILSSGASADIAPPQQPPGFSPEPGNEITQVRMLAETVTIDVLSVDPPQAHVSAFFTMRNLGSSTESMAVRFPIAASDGFSRFPEIKNVGIKVNNKNAFGFNIGKLNYNVALAGNAVAKGSSQKLAAVPAKGSGDISLPISINFAGALGSLSSLRTLLEGDKVSCTLIGDTELETPFGGLVLPFDTTQNIPIIK